MSTFLNDRRVYIILILLISTVSFAGITGKIAGYVKDAESGLPLPGANVMIEGTMLGSAADENGYYAILNVEPGTYVLKVSMIGYKPVTVRNVKVEMNLSTSINVNMSTEILGMAEVVVTAERPLVVRDVSHSQLNIDAKKIESLPVSDVTSVIALQAGIEGLSIRGGSSSQTAFIVDGFVVNDERSNIPYTSISLNTVNEVQVQTGGYNAEYGNCRSGVVNITTKEGDSQKYSGAISYLYRSPAKKHFGSSAYDSDTYYLRSYLDPDVCYVGTKNGTWDSYMQQQYPSFEGWIAISDRTLKDDNPDNDLSPEAAKKLFEWQHRRQGDINKSDYTMDLSLGGPVPFMSEKLGNLRFYASYRDLRDMFIVPVSSNAYYENVGKIKLTSDISNTMKLSFTGQYGEIHSTSPYNWTTTPTGYVWRSDYEIANAVNSEMLYVPAYYSPSSIYRTIFTGKFNHMLSSKKYYELSMQHQINRYKTYQMRDRDTELKYQPIPGVGYFYVDEAPYGYWGDNGVEAIGDQIRIGGWMNLGRERSVISTTRMKFDYTNQFNSFNSFKTGFNLVLNNYNIKSFTSNPGMTTWNREQVYQVFPYRIGLYTQNKMEFEGFIANIGLRLDVSDANTKHYLLEPYDSYYQQGIGDLIEEEAPFESAKPQVALSPRLGISHPITENSKLYFNYGHFRSEPSSNYRFRIQREYNGQVTSLGNSNLMQEKTVAYELGYSHSLFNKYLLNISAYYKDVTDQIGWISYLNINSSINYLTPGNNQYEDIRGFEITIDKRYGSWITGFINYTYMVGTTGYFGIMENYQNPTEQRVYLQDNPYQEKPHPRPYFRANLDFHSPDKFGPSLTGLYPAGGINISMIASWKAGSYETYNPNNTPGVINNVQWKDTYNINLRVKKTFSIYKRRLELYVDITNLLNSKFLSYAGFSSYNSDYIPYMQSLNFDWEEGEEHGNDRIGEYRPSGVVYDPLEPNPFKDPEISARNKVRKNNKSYIDNPNLTYFTFLNPRDIKFGIKITF